jgi:hypothetical protein
MILTYEDFKSHLIDSDKMITWDKFDEITSLNNFWDKLKEDDLRIKAFNNDKQAYKKFYYDYLIVGVDNLLKTFFERRISCDDIPNFDFTIIPLNGKSIRNEPDGIRYFRSKFNKDMSGCLNRYGFSLQNVIQRLYYEGRFTDPFTTPSVFKDIKLDDTSYIPESMIVTLRTRVGLVSVFSPKLYRSLLVHTQKYGNGPYEKVLFPCADWATPVVAVKDLSYKSLDIVDVMKDVLDGCHEVHTDVYKRATLFDDEPYELNTYLTPSERMTDLLGHKTYDHIFFCPPYYDLEIYEEGGMQSTTLYKTYPEWLEGYWYGTVLECDKVLRSGGVFAFVMANYVEGNYIGNDMVEIAKRKFKHVDTVKIETTKKNLSNEGEHRFESTYVFVKE